MPNQNDRKYPFDDIAIGERFLFPGEEKRTCQQAALHYGRRHNGEKYEFTERASGWMQCKRVA